MKFTEALEIISCDAKKTMHRKDWPCELEFREFLMVRERNGDTITPYTIHHFDFEYEWEIKE